MILLQDPWIISRESSILHSREILLSVKIYQFNSKSFLYCIEFLITNILQVRWSRTNVCLFGERIKWNLYRCDIYIEQLDSDREIKLTFPFEMIKIMHSELICAIAFILAERITWVRYRLKIPRSKFRGAVPQLERSTQRYVRHSLIKYNIPHRSQESDESTFSRKATHLFKFTTRIEILFARISLIT